MSGVSNEACISLYDVIIEIPAGSNVKYEIDSEGNIRVDRFLQTFMTYPANYGFFPFTLGGDGDCLDALVFTRSPLIPGCRIKVKPVGVLYVEDDKGKDEKIICVPCKKVDARFEYLNEATNLLNYHDIEMLKHFYAHYKELEEGKFCKVSGIGNSYEAARIIDKSIYDYNSVKTVPLKSTTKRE